MNASTSVTARSSAPLALAWFVTALVVSPLGALLFALSEGSGDRLLGLVLAGAGVLAAVTGAAVLARGDAVRTWSLVLSAALAALGLVAVGAALTGTPSFVEDALLLGLPPLVGGAVTGALVLRR
jgi:hypothetical protein